MARSNAYGARQVRLSVLLVFFLALDAWLIAFYVLSEHRVAVVDGHSVTNSSALLSQALTAVDRAYGGDIAALETASSDGSDPDECFFLRDAKGTFEPMMTCGGALLDHGCAGCGGEVDFILAVPFRVVQSKGGYVGEISDRPVAVEGSRVLSGDRLWRPDGETGTITNLGGGTLETDFGGFQNSGVIAGGAAVPVAFGALTVGALLATSRSRASKPASPQPARPSHTWDSLARTAFAPPVTPPSPVLVVPTAPPPAPDRQPALVGQLLAPEPANEPEQTSPPVLHGELREQAVRTTRVNVIGHIQVDGWAEQPTRAKTTELAVYLALHADRPVAAERLRTVIWAYDPSRGDVALATVHQEISRLRRCLGPDQFPDAKGGYQLASTVSSDWGDLKALMEASRAVGQAESIDYLRRALSLVRGEPFAEVAPKAYGWAFDEVIVAQMEAAVSGTAHVMAKRCLAMGKGADAAWAVRQGLLAVPRDERLREDQLVAAAGEGGQGLDRVWREVQRVLGPQSDESPLGVAFRRLRSAANN